MKHWLIGFAAWIIGYGAVYAVRHMPSSDPYSSSSTSVTTNAVPMQIPQKLELLLKVPYEDRETAVRKLLDDTARTASTSGKKRLAAGALLGFWLRTTEAYLTVCQEKGVNIIPFRQKMVQTFQPEYVKAISIVGAPAFDELRKMLMSTALSDSRRELDYEAHKVNVTTSEMCTALNTIAQDQVAWSEFKREISPYATMPNQMKELMQ